LVVAITVRHQVAQVAHHQEEEDRQVADLPTNLEEGVHHHLEEGGRLLPSLLLTILLRIHLTMVAVVVVVAVVVAATAETETAHFLPTIRMSTRGSVYAFERPTKLPYLLSPTSTSSRTGR
jgi:hypothetical protein